MKYAFLVYLENEEERQDCAATMGDYIEEARRKGYHLASEALHPVSTATTVRVRQGRTVVTDGPFAETKELLAGFVLMDCPPEEAEPWAGQLPLAREGAVEVRPFRVFDPPDGDRESS